LWPTSTSDAVPRPIGRRGWIVAGAGFCALLLLTAVASWLSIGHGGPSSPVYGNGSLPAATTWTWDGNDFTPQPVKSRGPNSSAADMVYDQPNGVVLLWDHGCSRLVMGFTGGCQSQVNETWTWDGRAWTRLRPASTPVAVGQGALLFDSRLGQVLYLNRAGQVWTWNGSVWQSQARSGGPRLTEPGSQANPSLSLVAAGYDETRRLLVLALPDATWAWDGQAWSRISGGIDAGDGQPDPRAVFDRALGQLVYLGTRSVWTWDGSRWQAHPQPGLAGGTLTYDPLRQRVLAVVQDTTACDRAGCPTRVWTWDGVAWSAQAPAHVPVLPLTRSGSINPPMAVDEARGEVVLFVSAA
jgi:hypothetical protein